MERSPALVWVSLLLGLGMLIHGTYAQDSPQDFVDAHNAARAEVGVGPIFWDDTVAAYAQNSANQRIGDCNMIHSNGPYGENLFRDSGRDYTGVDAMNSWVSEKSDYDYSTNTCATDKVCGRYTQVVSRNSVRLGCAKVTCNSGEILITCNYDPAGNVLGDMSY